MQSLLVPQENTEGGYDCEAVVKLNLHTFAPENRIVHKLKYISRLKLYKVHSNKCFFFR